MAGIGFRLQKLLSGESYTDLIKAYLYSAVISTGPMLVVMVVVGAVGQGVKAHLSPEDGYLFMGLILYPYAFSMMVSGFLLYIITRYLSDQHYLKRSDTTAATYLSVLEILFVIQGASALVYLYPLSLTLTAKWTVFCLYLLVSSIWISMTFLSVARSYFWIVFAFIIGAVVGILASLFLGHLLAFEGYLIGFTCGQGATFVVLTARIFLEFGVNRPFHNFEYFRYFKKYPALALTGFFYYLGIWADKLLFWFSPRGNKIGEHLYVYFDYDMPMFLAFMTIIPSMAFFLVEMETSFARTFQAYFRAVRNREGLGSLRNHLEAVRNNLTAHFQKFVLFQGTISGITIFSIYQIADVFLLNPAQMGILRIGILGAFLQMGFLMTLTILFYFDAQKEACLLTLTYFVTNSLFTFLSLKIGLPAYGFGYTTASFISLLVGFLVLDGRVKNLNYWTFMRQPVLVPKFKLETES